MLCNTRCQTRVPTDFATSVRTWRGLWRGQVVDLSAGGMQVRDAPAEIGLGELVNLTCRLPETLGTISIQGEVVHRWSDHLGIRFAFMSQAAQRELDRFLTRQLETAFRY